MKLGFTQAGLFNFNSFFPPSLFIFIMKVMTEKSYVTIEQINSSFRRSDILVDKNNEKLKVKKIKDSDDYKDLKKPKIKSDRVIIALSPENSSTIESEIEIEREKPESNITKKELDKLIYKSLWEFLNNYRSWAFKKMGVTDLDMVLANIRVVDVFLDNRKIFNPVGFQGEKLEIKLQGTFVPRDILPVVKHFSNFGKKMRVVEKFAISSLYVAEESGIIFNVDRHKSHLYEVGDKEFKYMTTHEIGLNDFISVISDSMKIKRWEAEEILIRYFDNNLSKKMNSFTKDKIEPLVNKVKSVTENLNNNKKIFINVPEYIFSEIFSGDSNIERIDFKKMLESHEFNVIISEENKSLFDEYSFLALVDYPVFSNHYEKLNNLLKKRSKWLVPNDSN